MLTLDELIEILQCIFLAVDHEQMEYSQATMLSHKLSKLYQKSLQGDASDVHHI